MSKLEISRELRGQEILLKCSGRLDANNSGHLNEYIDRIIREGQYQIALDLKEINYLSSAGIRSLVTQYKNLNAINGYFCIRAMSDNVSQVLQMVGMAEMLSLGPKESEAVRAADHLQDQITQGDFQFKISSLETVKPTKAEFYGQPDLVFNSGFTASHGRLIESQNNDFAFGLGAIGTSFEECKDRFGEYLLLGNNMAYLPADGSGKPDYLVSSGKLIASLIELYGIHFQGNFSHLVRFESDRSQATLGLSQLLEGIHQLCQKNQFALVMLAESGGLIGTSLNTSPVDAKSIFSFPEVKESIHFTMEPAYNKMLTLSVGMVSAEPESELSRFIRPLGPNSILQGHIHSCVFPYIPLKKTDIDLQEIMSYLFDRSDLSDILHLTHDTRELTGLGESQFVQGFCWIVPIESNTYISTN